MDELRNAELETEVVATKDDRLVEEDDEQDDEEHEEEEDRRRDIMLGNADDEIEFVPAKDDESDDDGGEETAFESVYEYETDVDAEDAPEEEEKEDDDGPATFRPLDDPERFAPSMPPHLQQSSSSSYSEEQPLQHQEPVLVGTTKEDDDTNEDGTGPNDSATIAVQRVDSGLASTEEDDGSLDAATESVTEPAADVAVVEKTTNGRGVLERRVADDTTTTTTEEEEESAFSELAEELSEEAPGDVDASVVAKPPSATATVSTTMVAPPSPTTITKPIEEESPYLSSGYWSTIDAVLSFGASSSRESLRLSRRLRRVRKATARATGLRGLLSGKDGGPFRLATTKATTTKTTEDEQPADEGALRRRFAAIDRARERIVHRVDADEAGLLLRGRSSSDPTPEPRRGGLFRRFGRRRRERSERRSAEDDDEEDEEIVVVVSEAEAARAAREEAIERRRLVAEAVEERRRRERVREIDRLIVEGQRTMLELQCEKDSLQRRPNPLYDYASDDGAGEEKVAKKKNKKKKKEEVTKDVSDDSTTTTTTTTRKFNFPSDSLVEDYLDELKRTRRLVALNHTRLWTDKPPPRRRRRRQDDDGADVEDDYDYYDYEDVGDDILTPSGNAHRLYDGKSRRRSNAGGSWLLRQTLGQGVTLGERLGQTVEEASYRSVCKAVMGVLAQSISAVHGINVMTHSDVRLYLSEEEQGRGRRRTEAMLRDTLSRKKRAKRDRAATNNNSAADDAPNDDASSFLQRDAVVETLISHCQISAPLLKLFPIDWQRAMLANLVAIVAAVTSDFCDGIRLQLLGHRLSLSFAPVTEEDLATIATTSGGRRARPEEFEAAVRVTARDVSASLTFLDRWHERALGSGMLRAQIGNLVARLVLTLVDGVLDGARIDLWSAQAGGPRVLAGLEHRSSSSSFDGDDDRGVGGVGAEEIR